MRKFLLHLHFTITQSNFLRRRFYTFLWPDIKSCLRLLIKYYSARRSIFPKIKSGNITYKIAQSFQTFISTYVAVKSVFFCPFRIINSHIVSCTSGAPSLMPGIFLNLCSNLPNSRNSFLFSCTFCDSESPLTQ